MGRADWTVQRTCSWTFQSLSGPKSWWTKVITGSCSRCTIVKTSQDCFLRHSIASGNRGRTGHHTSSYCCCEFHLNLLYQPSGICYVSQGGWGKQRAYCWQSRWIQSTFLCPLLRVHCDALQASSLLSATENYSHLGVNQVTFNRWRPSTQLELGLPC